MGVSGALYLPQPAYAFSGPHSIPCLTVQDQPACLLQEQDAVLRT